MSKHTPGPWTVSSVDAVNPRIDGPDGRGIAHATQRDAHPVIGQGITTGQAMANARLIAAAPELLESLTNLVELAKLGAARLDKYHAALADAERLIAKANGGSV